MKAKNFMCGSGAKDITRLSSFRQVALTSHLMKTLERPVYSSRTSLASEWTTLSSSSFTELSLTWRSTGSSVRIMFFDFSGAFNTIQPLLLGDRLEKAGVGHRLTHSLSALQEPRKGPFWLPSSSPSTLQTSGTTPPAASCRSSQMTLLLSASSRMRMTGSIEDRYRTLLTGASGTTCSSMQGRPKSWWWISAGEDTPP